MCGALSPLEVLGPVAAFPPLAVHAASAAAEAPTAAASVQVVETPL